MFYFEKILIFGGENLIWVNFDFPKVFPLQLVVPDFQNSEKSAKNLNFSTKKAITMTKKYSICG